MAINFLSDIQLPDDGKAVFGAGSDLQIYHDGSNSYIDDSGVGLLYIRGDAGINITAPSGGEVYAKFVKDAGCEFRYNDGVKFVTTNIGIEVTGEVQGDTLNIDGDADIDGTLEADAITVDGTTLAAYIKTTVGGMVTGNTETGIATTFQADGTLDFVVGTLNQDTTGTAAEATVLETSRNFQTNLASTSAAGFTGADECTPGVTGTLAVGNGGTGLTSVSTLLNSNVTSVSGNAGTATVATSVTASANDATNETVYLTFVDGQTGTQGIETDVALTYNPNTNLLSSQGFDGSLTGEVTGDVIGDLEGNADTATALATARTIGGVSFNGSANIDLPGVNAIGTQDRSIAICGDTDGDFNGDVVTFGAALASGDPFTVGAIYILNGANWSPTDADAAATAARGLLGVAIEAESVKMCIKGAVCLNHDPGGVGDILYLHTTPTECNATAPTGTDDIVRVVGYCLHATNGQVWFDPDTSFVEVA